MDDNSEPSLYRNGKVLTRRDPDGSDGGSEGVDLEQLARAAQLRLWEARTRARRRERGARLRHDGLEWPAVELDERIARLHAVPLSHPVALDAPGDARADRGAFEDRPFHGKSSGARRASRLALTT